MTASPIAPRQAPTAINTVPSGAFDSLIKGLPVVTGIVGVGYAIVEELVVLIEGATKVEVD